jgi:hypothetical protein
MRSEVERTSVPHHVFLYGTLDVGED